MIANLRPYNAMKDTGVPWLGEVPNHWEMPRLGAILRERGETNDNNCITDVLSVLRDRGVIPYAEKGNVGNKKSDDIRRYKIVRPDDIVVNCMNVIIGSVGLSRFTGCLSPVYYVLMRRSQSDDPRYLNAYFQTKPFQLSLVRIGNGILAHRMRIPMELLKCEPFPRPPADEQVAIVRFINHYDRKIRRYIRAKQKLIKLLEEEKQAIIHRAVTRGLDPNVRLKSSGVEWLGNIPQHWGFNRGKFYFKEVDVRSTSGKEELLSVSHITGVTPRSLKNINMFKAESYIGYKLCNPGQIAVNTMWAWMAAIGVSKYHGVISSSYHIYEQIRFQRFNDDFLDLLLRSTSYKNLYRVNSTGITSSRLRLYPEDFLNIKFLCPPKEEQESIIARVKDKTSSLVTAIARAEQETVLLREYHTRLIADVVTGKLDVREAAAQLPDEPEEPQLPEEIEDQAEGEEETEETDLDMVSEEASIAD